MKLTLEQIRRIIREELEYSIGQWKSIYGQSEPGISKISSDKDRDTLKDLEHSKGENNNEINSKKTKRNH